jgi:hypothetical protein
VASTVHGNRIAMKCCSTAARRSTEGIDEAAVIAEGCRGNATRQGESKLRGCFRMEADRRNRDARDDR